MLYQNIYCDALCLSDMAMFECKYEPLFALNCLAFKSLRVLRLSKKKVIYSIISPIIESKNAAQFHQEKATICSKLKKINFKSSRSSHSQYDEREREREREVI
jgi:hypothetical protein